MESGIHILLYVPGGTRAQTKPLLDYALGLNTEIAISQLDRCGGAMPPLADLIRQGVVRYEPEPPGLERFDPPSVVLARGWGDCDDLSCWRAGELRYTGEDPGAHAFVYPSGYKKWHAIVGRSDGREEDPSLLAGMGRRRKPLAFSGAVTSPLNRLGDASVAIKELGGGRHVARVDVPNALGRFGLTHVTSRANPVTALRNAVLGAIGASLAHEAADPEVLVHLVGLARVLHGEDPRSVARVLGVARVGFVRGLLAGLQDLQHKRRRYDDDE